MFRQRNVAGSKSRSLSLIALLLVSLVMTSATRAQPSPAEPAPGAARLTAPRLDTSHARQIHQLVEQWVRQGSVDAPPPADAPETSETPEAAPIVVPEIEVTDLFAVRVTLRIQGHRVGTGDAIVSSWAGATAEGGPADEPVDLIDLASQATRGALAELTETLKDVRMRAVIEGQMDPSRPAPTPADVGRRVLVDIQLARRPQRVQIPADAPPGAVLGTFAGGYHGLRAWVPGNDQASLIWPASALAANTPPDSQLVQLLRGQGLRHDQVILLGRPDAPGAPGAPGIPGTGSASAGRNPILQRFEIIHVVRPRAELPAMELVRGNVVLPPLSVSSRTLAGVGDQLANHLAARFIEGGMRGTYRPTSDRYDPPLAGDEDLAIACYALVRHSALIRRSTPGAPAAMQHARVALDMAVRLGRRGVGDPPRDASPAAAAYILLTLADADLPGRQESQLRDDLTQRLLAVLENPEEADLNETRIAVITAGLAAVYQQTRDPALGQAVHQSLNQLWQDAGGNPNPAALPWIVMAVTRAERLLAADDPEAAEALAQREQVLGDLVDRLGRQQVIEPPLLGPTDVIGGFELYRAPSGSPPNPDWRTAHLLSFLSLCLADDAIAQGHNRFDWVLTAGLAARFVAQLMMDEPACFYARSPRDARSGIRLALWNNHLAVAPTAVSLLAVTQLQEATQSLEAPQ